MILQNNSKLPYWLLFIIYLAFNNVLFVLFTVGVSALIDLIDFCKGDFYSSLALLIITWPFIYVCALPTFIPVIYLKLAHNVKQIEINMYKRSIYVVYKTFFFKRKEKKFLVDDDDFTYDFNKKSKPMLLQKMYAHTLGTSVGFFYKGRVCITIRETSGWTNEQLDLIISTLKEIKPPVDFSKNHE